jgi:transposase
MAIGLNPNCTLWKALHRHARKRSAEIWQDFITHRYHFISSGPSSPEIKLSPLRRVEGQNRRNAFDVA